MKQKIQENLEYIKYTFKHRRAIYLVAKKVLPEDIFESMRQRLVIHDIDKLFMYVAMNKKDASEYHRNHQRHHVENDILKTKEDYIETILDYECAHLTKEDKPMLALETINTIHPTQKNNLIPIIKELGLGNTTVEDYIDIKKQLESDLPSDNNLLLDMIVSDMLYYIEYYIKENDEYED